MYVIQPISKKSPMQEINQLQLFNLNKSKEDPIEVDSSICVQKLDPRGKKMN